MLDTIPARRLSRRARPFALALAALIGLSPALAPRAQAAETTLVIARDMDITSLDPARAFCDTCQIVLSATYERLVDLGPDNRTIVPLLAESWEVNADQTVFTFKLDERARFADGGQVTSADVAWSLERLKHLKGNPSFLMDGVAAVETPDARTVVIRTTAPNSELLGILAAPYAAVVNRAVAEANGAKAGEGADTADQADGWFLANSAGSGPFTLAAYAPDDEVRLARNAGYWRDAAPVAQVVIKQVKDSVTQAQMLQSGAADIAMQIDADTAAGVTDPNVVIEPTASFNFVYVALGAGADGMPISMTRPVREAIGLALDYEGIIDLTVAGKGRRIAAPIPNGFPGTEGLPLPARDLDRAKALLAEAGIGGRVTLEAVYPSVNIYGVDFDILMQKVQQDLGDVGLDLALQPVTFPVWRERITATGIPVTAVYYAPDYFGSGQYVQFFGTQEGSPWYKRSHAAKAPDAVNPRIPDLLAAALAAPAEKVDEAFAAIAREMIADRIILPVVSPDLTLAYRKGVKGVRYSACCNLPLAEISVE